MIERTWEKAFLEALRKGRTQQEAADFAGTTMKTVKRHKARDPELRRRVKEAIAEWHRQDAQDRLEYVQAMLR